MLLEAKASVVGETRIGLSNPLVMRQLFFILGQSHRVVRDRERALPWRGIGADSGVMRSQKRAPLPRARLSLPLGNSCLKKMFLASASTFPGTPEADGGHVTVSTYDQLVPWDPLDRL